MSRKRFVKGISFCLIASLIIAGPVFGQEFGGVDSGIGQIDDQFQRPSGSLDSEIQGTNSGLFHPYISLTTNVSGEAVGVGDFNHDGLLDAAMTGKNSTTLVPSLYIFLQNEYGHLSKPVLYPSTDRSESLAVGDLNHDGWDDVVTADMNDNTISVYLQLADGSLASRVTYPVPSSEAVVCGDFNSDGWDDVAVAQWSAPNLRVFIQQSDGTLDPIDLTSPSAGWDDIDAGDLNNDSHADIVKMNGQGMNPNLSVYLQDPDTHELSNTPVSYDDPDILLPSNIAAGDVNGDGRQDVVVTSNSPGKLTIWAQNTSGTLDKAASYDAYSSPGATEIADVNGDGRNDVTIAHTGWLNLGVFLQKSDGTLNPYELYPLNYGPYNAQGMDIGDVNNDGLPDVVFAAYDLGLVVMYHKGSDMILASTPTSRTVYNGTIAPYQISVLVPAGFSDPITLGVNGLPAGVTAEWSANPVTSPDYTATLTLTVGAGTAGGDYTITVTGASGLLTDQIDIGLKVNRLEMVFLPLIQRSKIIYYKDDFSNSGSGWPIMSNSIGIWNYVAGEYQMLMLNPDYFLWATAGHNPVNYDMQVDARQVGSIDAAYGIIFGINDTETQYYLFIIDPHPDYRRWALFYWDGSTLSRPLGWYYSGNINTGTSINKVEIVRKNYYVTLKINGANVYTDYYIPTWSDNRRIGLVTVPYAAGSEVRFDNYLVTEP